MCFGICDQFSERLLLVGLRAGSALALHTFDSTPITKRYNIIIKA